MIYVHWMIEEQYTKAYCYYFSHGCYHGNLYRAILMNKIEHSIDSNDKQKLLLENVQNDFWVFVEKQTNLGKLLSQQGDY